MPTDYDQQQNWNTTHRTKTIKSNLNEEIAHDETVVKPFNGDDKIEDTQRERHRLNRSAY